MNNTHDNAMKIAMSLQEYDDSQQLHKFIEGILLFYVDVSVILLSKGL